MSTLYVWKQAGPKTPRIYQAETCLIRSWGVVSISPIKATRQIRSWGSANLNTRRTWVMIFAGWKRIVWWWLEFLSGCNHQPVDNYEWLISLFLRGYIVIWYFVDCITIVLLSLQGWNHPRKAIFGLSPGNCLLYACFGFGSIHLEPHLEMFVTSNPQ